MPSGAESDLLEQVSVQLSGLAVSTVRTTAAGRRTLQINISDSSQDDPLHASSSSGGPPSPAGGEEAGGPSGTDGASCRRSGLPAQVKTALLAMLLKTADTPGTEGSPRLEASESSAAPAQDGGEGGASG